jgi:hypothetical protein
LGETMEEISEKTREMKGNERKGKELMDWFIKGTSQWICWRGGLGFGVILLYELKDVPAVEDDFRVCGCVGVQLCGCFSK